MQRLLFSLGVLCGSLAAAPAAYAQEGLTFTNWYYEGDIEKSFEVYRTSFEAAHPEVGAVKVEVIPYPRFLDTLNLRLASGNPPDVSWIDASHGPGFIAAERLVDLSPAIEADADFNLADFGAAMDPWTIDGKVYGIPFTNAGNVVYYNEDIFAKAGVPTPRELLEKGEWTWAKVHAISRDLVARGGARYGFDFGNNLFTTGWQNLVDILPTFGGAPWSSDGKTCLFTDPKTIEAMQIVHDMIYTDRTHPEPGVEVDFAAGDMGMSLTRADFAFRLNDVTFKWDVVPTPSGPEGYVPSLAQNAIGVFKGAKHEALGAAFAVWSTNPENDAIWTASASPRLSLQSLDILSKNNVLSAEQLERAVIPAMQSKKFQLEYTHRNFGPLTSEVERLFSSLIWVPDANLGQATSEICKQIKPLLQ
ncbi:MAG: extracellular solute-binding protein [Devosia sp.]|uniref:ABC transporter substrate-binding protein n=1 Tax=Devosia sp. TaxID=1871048 RepID=UPI001A5472B4|nr:extracellular solute-binding protein [Devosia sp.]MBL8598944.1 extracellular solute-binding protein [Devosia sp.]